MQVWTETTRLILVQVASDLAPAMARYVAKNIERFALAMPMPTESSKVSYWVDRMAQYENDMRSGRALHLVGFAKNGEPHSIVCDINFTNIVRGVFHACYLGFKVDAKYEGKGLVHECLEAAISKVFAEMRLHRIMANYEPSNERSAKLLRRSGFEIEGHAKDYLYLGGRWRDHVLTARINRNWSPEP